MDRQEVIAVLDLHMVGQELAAHWPSYRERIADALMALEGGGGGGEALGLVADGNHMEGAQASGDLPSRHLPCPVFTSMLFDTIWKVRDKVITGPEERTVDDCLQAVRDLLNKLDGGNR